MDFRKINAIAQALDAAIAAGWTPAQVAHATVRLLADRLPTNLS